jgi:6-pyruvoyltetrahydropterin/6-carboxytetrahydropterin synthase
VIDFGVLKKVVRDWIDAEWDHSCILHKDDPLIQYLLLLKNKIFIMPDNPTAEHMAIYLYGIFINLIKDVDIESVTVWETPNNPATYKPTKKE